MKDGFWVEESRGNPSVCKKRKRRTGKRTIEFIGWGSTTLIEFLEAIGQDTREKISRHEVAAFITKYINDKGLACAEKKKKVLCDERLRALFRKKTLSRIKIYDMLEEHFAENHDDSDDELWDSSDDDDRGENGSLSSRNKPPSQMKKKPKSCFAAVISENIKLLHLKKSVIQELLKFPESFEFKMVGSFVRMKCDPNDIYQKNRFQLQQVTGIEKVSGVDDAGIEIRLRVSNFFKDIPISMLSDDNFSEEEVEDLRDRIKAGSFNRLTVNEVQSKAEVLHVDITKHWIAKEISLLQNLIDRANEKGWRKELFEYRERRKMLQTPSEQEKLLLKIPEVIAEELEPEESAAASDKADQTPSEEENLLLKTPQVIAEELEQEGTVAAASEKAEGACSPKSILRASSNVSSTDASGDRPADIIDQGMFVANMICDGGSRETQVTNSGGKKPDANSERTLIADVVSVANVICNGGIRETEVGNSGGREAREKAAKPWVAAGVIDLSLDEDGDIGETADKCIWHYVDPRGNPRGPFSLYLLKRWSDSNYFPPGFRVWKTGQTLHDGVVLVDVLRRAFPHSIFS